MIRRLAALVTAAALLAACGGGSDVPLSEGDAAAGAQVFTANCAACHGADGTGTPTGPSLLDGELDAEAVAAAVREGVDDPDQPFGPMPAVAGLDGQAVADVAAHVLRLREDG